HKCTRMNTKLPSATAGYQNICFICEMCGTQNLCETLCLFALICGYGFRDHVPYVERRRTVSIDLFRCTPFNSPDLFRRFLVTNIVFADKEHNVLNKLKRMREH